MGIGLAAYVEVCGFEDWGAARVQVHTDGSVTVFVETLDQGQGHRTAFAQLVAGVLGIAIERVRVEQGDTASAPSGWGTSGSRSVAQGGSASHAAAEKVAEKAMKMGVREVEVLVNGPGAGRESAIRSLAASGLKIRAIEDVTPIPHNGCRPRKRRRV